MSSTLTRAKTPAAASTTPARGRSSIARTPRTFYWMVVPAVVIFFGLHTIPVLSGMFFSLTNYAGYGTWDLVGFSNYINLFQDDRVLNSYAFTFGFAIVSTLLVNVIALAIALGLNSKIKFQAAFRGVFFIPYVLAILIIGYVFNYLFANSFPAIFTALGLPGLSGNLLASPDFAWIGIVITTVWQAAAFNVILYLAGLQTISADLYEAAAIDGASAWQRFRRVTLPLIMPVLTIVTMFSIIWTFADFQLVYVLTRGGPANSTHLLATLAYNIGMVAGELGNGAAISLWLFPFMVLLVIGVLWYQRRETGQ
jgi:raffinose/stachyose/melibiose transport system permease protein